MPLTSPMDAVHENRLLSRWGELLPRAPGQQGAIHETDAELVELGDGRLLALTVDSISEELAIGLYSPRLAGRIAVVACLSDLAAVGAVPLGLLLSVNLPGSNAAAVQEAIAMGVREACATAGVFVLGGDTTEADALQVTMVGVGTVPCGVALSRRGCRPGDRVFATGPLGLGGAFAAARLLGLGGGRIEFRPSVRIRAGCALRGVASACIDTSDGLIAAVDQLARLNGVAVRIREPLEALIHPDARELGRSARLPPFVFLASHHGEYELVFTAPESVDAALPELARRGGFTPLLIGSIEAGNGIRVGAVEIDAARVRNLARDCGRDIAAYAAALIETGPP